MLEFRWHGRGGQGAVTASKILADALIESGKYIQAFPEYGPERRGAPVKAFNRISDEPILVHDQVYTPDVVIVIDPTLLGSINVTEGLKKGGKVIVNTVKSKEELRKFIPEEYEIYTVDATSIAREFLKDGNRVNTPMLGAVAKVTGVVDLEYLDKAIEKNFGKKLPEKIVEANKQAVAKAYQEVK